MPQKFKISQDFCLNTALKFKLNKEEGKEEGNLEGTGNLEGNPDSSPFLPSLPEVLHGMSCCLAINPSSNRDHKEVSPG